MNMCVCSWIIIFFPSHNISDANQGKKMRKWCISSSFKLMSVSKLSLFLPLRKIISRCRYYQLRPQSWFYSSVAPSGKHSNWLVCSKYSTCSDHLRLCEDTGRVDIFVLQWMWRETFVLEGYISLWSINDWYCRGCSLTAWNNNVHRATVEK